MPIKYTREEIRRGLEELGFREKDEHMLDIFIKDLRRVIKYDVQSRRKKKLGHIGEDTKGTSVTNISDEALRTEDMMQKYLRTNTDIENIATSYPKEDQFKPHETDQSLQIPKRQHFKRKKTRESQANKENFTVSRAVQATSIDNHLLNEGKDSHKDLDPLIRSKSKHHWQMKKENFELQNLKSGSQGQTIPENVENIAEYDHSKSPRSKWKSAKECMEPANLENLDCDYLINMLDNLIESDEVAERNEAASTGTRSDKPIRKKLLRDPVALYGYYCNYWKKFRIPGQDRHMQLRWNVRADTMGNYPCIDGRPIKYKL